MPRPREHLRDFPGRRVVNIVLRCAHVAGVVLLGAGLFGAGTLAPGIWLAGLSGVGMFAGDLWTNPGHLRELAGITVLLKLALLGLMPLQPDWAFPIFWALLVVSVLVSHAPAAIRHRRMI